MFQKTRRFLVISFTCLAILCIVVFLWVGTTIGQKSEDAVSEIGEIYMSEMSRQLQQKFTAIIDSRFSQVEGVIQRVKQNGSRNVDKTLNELAIGARVREFTYLGLFTEDGEDETVYGESVTIYDRDVFLQDLIQGRNKVTSGESKSGERILLMGANASYKMKSGKVSKTLVVGIPMSYLEKALVLEGKDSLVFSHIIREDGNYVIRTVEAFHNSYFERLIKICENYKGKTPEQYVAELKEAITAQKEYCTMVMVDGEHRHIYSAHLPNSDWYLISVMPYSKLDDAISNLGAQRLNTIMGACIAILIAFIAIFVLYYRMSQQQMREMEEARKEAQRANRAKSEFLSNMSHDIRTPMNGIVGMTAIARTNIDDKVRVEDCLKKITMSSRHLLGLINDILDMSKIENGKLSLNMDQISLRETMDSIVNIVQPQIKSKQQHFDIFIQKITTENVYCDSVRLNQVIINLLSNAVKFTPENGTIHVYLSQEESPKGDDYIRCHFRVKDNGIGMTPEFQETIFETFTRERTKQVQKTEGTGLGMAITKCIVDAMKGSIELTSAPQKGTEFHITLDLEKAEVLEEDMILPSWNMLVVDNNEDLCSGAVSALREIGVNAECALDGETAVDMVEKRHKDHADYHIVLIDWKMPGMDGLQTTREIRKRVGDEMPILIISAYDWNDIEEEALEAGVQGFISKPLFKSNLYLGLRQFVDGVSEEPKQEDDELEYFVGKRILLAEDNDLNWEIAEDILTNAGFELERAENGQVCVDKFNESEVGYYDVVLMDIRMPVMDGYGAAENIRALERPDADLPIIAMTADAFSEDIQHCLDCGMNAHIAKPIDVKKLIQQLHQYLKL